MSLAPVAFSGAASLVGVASSNPNSVADGGAAASAAKSMSMSESESGMMMFTEQVLQ
jgi:hypothetical protein